MAALAFGLRFEPAFRDSFLAYLRTTFGTPSTAAASTKIEIEIEPDNWCDLKIVEGESIYVIEGKIDANLKAHQDPSQPNFYTGEGRPAPYGVEMLKERSRAGHPIQYHYLVLTQDSDLVQKTITPPPEGITAAFHEWTNLAQTLEQIPSLSDLSESLIMGLGQIGIQAFKTSYNLMHSRKLTITGGFESAIAALTILEAAIEDAHLEISTIEHSKLGSDTKSSVAWNIGPSKNSKKETNQMKALRSLVKPEDTNDTLAWVAFENDGSLSTMRCIVCLYCETASHALKVLKALLAPEVNARFPAKTALEIQDQNAIYVAIAMTDITGPAVDWFSSVLKTLVGIGATEFSSIAHTYMDAKCAIRAIASVCLIPLLIIQCITTIPQSPFQV